MRADDESRAVVPFAETCLISPEDPVSQRDMLTELEGVVSPEESAAIRTALGSCCSPLPCVPAAAAFIISINAFDILDDLKPCG